MLSGKGTGKGKDPKWRNWAARFIEPEILESADGEQMRRNLREIALVNRLFGGHRVARRLFGEVATPPEYFTLLDVGAASGDMGAAVLRAFPRATVISLDLSPLHLVPQRGPGWRRRASGVIIRGSGSRSRRPFLRLRSADLE